MAADALLQKKGVGSKKIIIIKIIIKKIIKNILKK